MGEFLPFGVEEGDLTSIDDAPERLRKGLARHPVPLMLLDWLAVSLTWQGKSVGAGLLKEIDGGRLRCERVSHQSWRRFMKQPQVYISLV
jgi:hypothetical protein